MCKELERFKIKSVPASSILASLTGVVTSHRQQCKPQTILHLSCDFFFPSLSSWVTCLICGFKSTIERRQRPQPPLIMLIEDTGVPSTPSDHVDLTAEGLKSPQSRFLSLSIDTKSNCVGVSYLSNS